MMACDICGGNEKTLVDLRDEYKTENVKQICPACEKTINDHLWKIRAVTTKMSQSLLKRFMEAMKARLMGSNAELRGASPLAGAASLSNDVLCGAGGKADGGESV